MEKERKKANTTNSFPVITYFAIQLSSVFFPSFFLRHGISHFLFFSWAVLFRSRRREKGKKCLYLVCIQHVATPSYSCFMWGGGKGCSCKLERKKNFRKRQKEKRVGKRERNKNRKQFRKIFNSSKLPLFSWNTEETTIATTWTSKIHFKDPQDLLENWKMGEKTCNFMWVQDSRAVLMTTSFFSVPGVVQPPTPLLPRWLNRQSISRIFLEKKTKISFARCDDTYGIIFSGKKMCWTLFCGIRK